MSTFKYILILIGLLILLGIMYILRSAFIVPVPILTPTTPVDDGGAIACTMDVMMCPDGTYVGRSGPNCQFVCPSSSPAAGGGTTSLYEAFTIGLGQSKTVGHTTIKPWAVTQDSRCPSDVMCIQAGKVTVAFNISSPAGDSVKEITIGDTMGINSLIFTLKDVQPYPVATKKTQDADYRFVMDVEGK
jgi:hypothetical protein